MTSVQAWQGQVVSGELPFPWRAELPWAGQLGWWPCHLSEVSLTFANGLAGGGELSEADSP